MTAITAFITVSPYVFFLLVIALFGAAMALLIITRLGGEPERFDFEPPAAPQADGGALLPPAPAFVAASDPAPVAVAVTAPSAFQKPEGKEPRMNADEREAGSTGTLRGMPSLSEPPRAISAISKEPPALSEAPASAPAPSPSKKATAAKSSRASTKKAPAKTSTRRSSATSERGSAASKRKSTRRG